MWTILAEDIGFLTRYYNKGVVFLVSMNFCFFMANQVSKCNRISNYSQFFSFVTSFNGRLSQVLVNKRDSSIYQKSAIWKWRSRGNLQKSILLLFLDRRFFQISIGDDDIPVE
jgi:hypothetical protein